MIAPRSAVSRCTPRSRSLVSRRYPRRCRDANGANLTFVDRTRLGENAAERGRGLGPLTVQVSFREDEVGVRDCDLEGGLGGASSRYADPEAEGVRPVLRTRRGSYQHPFPVHPFLEQGNIQIFLNSLAFRVRFGLIEACSEGRELAKTGGRVPPGGPLIRRRSAITQLLQL